MKKLVCLNLILAITLMGSSVFAGNPTQNDVNLIQYPQPKHKAQGVALIKQHKKDELNKSSKKNSKKLSEALLRAKDIEIKKIFEDIPNIIPSQSSTSSTQNSKVLTQHSTNTNSSRITSSDALRATDEYNETVKRFLANGISAQPNFNLKDYKGSKVDNNTVTFRPNSPFVSIQYPSTQSTQTNLPNIIHTLGDSQSEIFGQYCVDNVQNESGLIQNSQQNSQNISIGLCNTQHEIPRLNLLGNSQIEPHLTQNTQNSQTKPIILNASINKIYSQKVDDNKPLAEDILNCENSQKQDYNNIDGQHEDYIGYSQDQSDQIVLPD